MIPISSRSPPLLAIAALASVVACSDDGPRDAAPDVDSSDAAEDSAASDTPDSGGDADDDALPDTDVADDADATDDDAEPEDANADTADADTADDAGDDPDVGDAPDSDDADAGNDADAGDDADTGDDADAGNDADAGDVADADDDPDADDDADAGDVPDAPVDVPDTDAPDGDDASTGPPVCSPITAPTFAAAPVTQRFTEVASARGISGPQTILPAEFGDAICGEAIILTGGAAIEDYDDDGDLDIFVPRLGQPDQLWQNDGAGNFVDVAPALGIDSDASSNSAAWVDIDADGDLDIYVQTLGGHPNRMWVQTDAGWVDEAPARGLAMVGDVHRNGEGCSYLFGATFADIDRDGDLDLTTSRWLPVSSLWAARRLDNDGTGVFTDVTDELGPDAPWRLNAFGVTWADFDDDDDLDALITADFETSRYFRNDDGEFLLANALASLGTDENGMGTSVADFDGDDDLDIFVTAIRGETGHECSFNWGCTGNRLYVNEGDGTFADCTDAYGVRDGNWGWGVLFFDADLDGDADIAQTAGYDIPWDRPDLAPFRAGVARYRDGASRFWRAEAARPWPDTSETVGFSHPGKLGRALVPFDMEGDGDLDLLVIHNTGEPSLFQNTGAESRAWLRVRLQDPTSLNTHAIGATVRLRASADGPWFRADIRAGGDTYLSTRPFEAHFGLGDFDGAIDTLEVTWPTGGVTTYRDVAHSRVLTITRAP